MVGCLFLMLPTLTSETGGLAEEVNERILHAAFLPFGEIVEIQIPVDFENRKSTFSHTRTHAQHAQHAQSAEHLLGSFVLLCV
jgi:predicted thioesterase